MEVLSDLMFAAALALGVLALWLFGRNVRVMRFRLRLIDQIDAAAKSDLDAGHVDWEWRFDVYSAVSYDEMLLRFWVRLEDFYEDYSFTKPTVIELEGSVQ